MANMSYCRFYNTRRYIADCLAALDGKAVLSTYEAVECELMFLSILEYFEEQGIANIDWQGYDNWMDNIKNRSDASDLERN